MLGAGQKLRYNQLTAMMANEIIAFMETEFLVAALSAVEARQGDPRQPPGLQAAVRRFRDDERRHADIWHNLNRLSEPEWYASTNWRLLGIPRAALTAARLVARRPVAFPVVFWLQLVQEERSLEISRRCMRVPPQAMEPRYAAAYTAHLPDEARHVQIDRHLIDRFYRPREHRRAARHRAAVQSDRRDAAHDARPFNGTRRPDPGCRVPGAGAARPADAG